MVELIDIPGGTVAPLNVAGKLCEVSEAVLLRVIWDDGRVNLLTPDGGAEHFHLPGQHDQQSHAGDDARNEASGAALKSAADGPLPKAVVDAFLELGDAQRGRPETAMRNYQHQFSGVMNVAVEHIGDLTHRMTHMLKWGDDQDGREYVVDKVEKTERWLTNRYGFDKEHEENLRVVAKTRFDGDYNKARTAAEKALNVYADEHAKLPVYNRAQWLGREAAIQLGRGNTWGAVDALRELKGLAADAKTWNRSATEYRLGADGKPQLYVTSKSFTRTDFHLPGQHDQQAHAGDGTPLDKRGRAPRRGGKPDPARVAAVTTMAKELGIKRFEVRYIPTPQNSWFSDIPPDAIIMGQFDPSSRLVRFNSDALEFPDHLVLGILRHEGGHAEFHAAERARASGVREYVKQNERRLAAEGRISAYARMFWRDYDDSKKELKDPLNDQVISRSILKEDYKKAVNESFAELRRRFPDKPEKWPPSYRRLDTLVRKHHARA